MFFDNAYITIDSLTTRLGLPEKYLLDLADAGKIPALTIKGKRRFREKAVVKALAEIEQLTQEERERDAFMREYEEALSRKQQGGRMHEFEDSSPLGREAARRAQAAREMGWRYPPKIVQIPDNYVGKYEAVSAKGCFVIYEQLAGGQVAQHISHAMGDFNTKITDSGDVGKRALLELLDEFDGAEFDKWLAQQEKEDRAGKKSKKKVVGKGERGN